jgi:hypothetical protein
MQLIISEIRPGEHPDRDGISWNGSGPTGNSMWFTIVDGAVYIQFDYNGDGKPDRIVGVGPNDTSVRVVLDRWISVSSVAFGANDGALAAGEPVAVVVKFSAPVTLTDGLPTLALSNGGIATYVSGAGTNRLVFSYTPVAGEDTADLAIAGLTPGGAQINGLDGEAVFISRVATNPPGMLSVDTVAPSAPTVTLATDTGSPGDGITNSGMLSITGIEASATVQYSTDGGVSWSRSFSPVEGANTVLVRQVDMAGNASHPSSVTFLLDPTRPSAPLLNLVSDSGVAGDRITNTGALAVTGVEAGATVQYSADGGVSWSETFAAVEGPNVVLVRQLDMAGNSSSVTALTFTLDTSAAAPSVSLAMDSGVAGDRISNNGTLSLSSFETGATVQYSTDDGASWTGTFSPIEGMNTILVRQVDVAGNLSPPTSFSFTFDTTAPTAASVALAMDGGTPGDGLTNTAALNVTGTEAGATVQYSVNGGATWSSTFNAAEGPNTVLVRQVDAAGNASGPTAFTFTLDTIAPSAPAVTLASDSGVAGDRITNAAMLNVTGTDSGTTVEYSTDSGANWTSSFTAAEGLNTILVRQVDAAGNSSASQNFSFTLDTTADAPSVSLAVDGGAPGDGITNNGTLSLAGVETGATVQYSTDGGSVWSPTFMAVGGANTVLVRQLDVAGNLSAATSFIFTLDTAAPATPSVALVTDSGTAGDKVTNIATLNVAGTESGATVQYSTNGGTTWSSSFTAAEGSNTVLVRQVDVAGNSSSATGLTFVLDTAAAAPGVTLATDSGTAGDNITSNSALMVTGSEIGATVQYSTNGGTTWLSTFTPTEGANNVLVRQVDLAGNASSATSFTFTLDTAAPSAPSAALVIDSGTAGDKITRDGTLNITGTETGATVLYSTNGGTSWSSSFTPAEGANTVLIRQVDLAGNTSSATSFTFTLDTAAPAAPGVALVTDSGTSGDNITSDGAFNVTGTESGSSVQYSTDGGTTWLSNFTPTEGTNTVLIRQTDVAHRRHEHSSHPSD